MDEGIYPKDFEEENDDCKVYDKTGLIQKRKDIRRRKRNCPGAQNQEIIWVMGRSLLSPKGWLFVLWLGLN
jgi:hypothetical protein